MLALAWLIACPSPVEPPDTDSPTDSDVFDTDDVDTDGASPLDFDHSDEIGEVEPPFALEDLNPSSATFGEIISSEELAGHPYALIFLASQCKTVKDIADDLWAAYEENPGWWDELPLYAVESSWSYEGAPQTVERVVEGNALPYLLDTEETNLWGGYGALNHDFFAVSAKGTLEVWLPLYSWPEDYDMFAEYMESRGE